jgi:hypothetical protein
MFLVRFVHALGERQLACAVFALAAYAWVLSYMALHCRIPSLVGLSKALGGMTVVTGTVPTITV